MGLGLLKLSIIINNTIVFHCLAQRKNKISCFHSCIFKWMNYSIFLNYGMALKIHNQGNFCFQFSYVNGYKNVLEILYNILISACYIKSLTSEHAHTPIATFTFQIHLKSATNTFLASTEDFEEMTVVQGLAENKHPHGRGVSIIWV